MDLRDLYAYGERDIEGYRPPVTYELCSRQIEAVCDNKKQTLTFGKAPVLELVCEDGASYPYTALKITDTLYQVSFITGRAGYMYVLDGGQVPIASVCFEEPAIVFRPPKVKATDDFAGNTIDWVFGSEPLSHVRVRYGRQATEVGFPLVGNGGKKLFIPVFIAYKISEGIYLQFASLDMWEPKMVVCLISDFHRVLSAGTIFTRLEDGTVMYQTIGAYGKVQTKM
jgi:hypothetical protein